MHDINLKAGMAFPVGGALTDRSVPLKFAMGDNEAKIPPRCAQVMQCEEPINPIEIARALFDRGCRLSRFHNIPYQNYVLGKSPHEHQPGKSVPAPGSWRGLESKAAKVAYTRAAAHRHAR